MLNSLLFSTFSMSALH